VDPLSLALEAAPKALVYVAVLLAVGTCAARSLFRRRVSFDAPPHAAALVDRTCAGLAITAALLAAVGLLLRAWGHTAASFGIIEAFDWQNLRLIAWESDWGGGWRRQCAAALVFGVCAWSITQWGDAGWSLADLGAVALCYAIPLTGHAAGEPGPLLLHGTHVLAGGLWLGTLTATALVTHVAGAGDPRGAPGEPPSLRTHMLARFFPLALTGAVVALATGLAAVCLYLGPIGNLLSTTYGWALLMKVVFVGDVVTFGFLNWKSLHRPPSPDAARLRTTFLFGEIVMAAAVVAVTAVLTEVGHP
jgi:putative copper export protein